MKIKDYDSMNRFSNIAHVSIMNSTHTRGLIICLFATTLLFLNSGPLLADTYHSGPITGDSTWSVSGNDHIITGTVTVNAGASLTIDDGVTVRFEDYGRIDVYGSLNATGSGTGILFTRYQAGDEWEGLYFQSGASGTLQHCTIEYATYFAAGYGVWTSGAFPIIENCTIRNNRYGINVQNATSPTLSVANTIQDNSVTGIRFYNCTNPSVFNQTITGHNTTWGAIFMDRTGEFTIGGGNTIGGGGQENSWPLTIGMHSYPSAATVGNIPTSGNSNNGIQVLGGTTTDSLTWVAGDYILTGDPNISAGGILNINDGVTVRFEDYGRIDVYGSLNATGSGTGILFTRYQAGDEWEGLYFQSGASGTLQHCTIEYATYFAAGYGVWTSGAFLTIENCTIKNNNVGVRASSGTLSFRNNKIINNTNYGINLCGAVSACFGSNSSEWNDIYSNGGGSAGRDLYNGTIDTYAPYVYWGTEVGPEIDTKIWDENDNLDLGKVCYAPWFNASHDQATPTWLTITLENGLKSSSGDMRLIWAEYCGEGGVNYYVIYRSTTPGTRGDSLAGTTSNEYLDVGVVGNIGTNYYYIVEVVNGVGNRWNSNQVGEFDIELINGI